MLRESFWRQLHRCLSQVESCLSSSLHSFLPLTSENKKTKEKNNTSNFNLGTLNLFVVILL